MVDDDDDDDDDDEVDVVASVVGDDDDGIGDVLCTILNLFSLSATILRYAPFCVCTSKYLFHNSAGTPFVGNTN